MEAVEDLTALLTPWCLYRLKNSLGYSQSIIDSTSNVVSVPPLINKSDCSVAKVPAPSMITAIALSNPDL